MSDAITPRLRWTAHTGRGWALCDAVADWLHGMAVRARAGL